MNLFLGTFYLWGNIGIYVLSYYHQFDHSLSYDFIFLVDTFAVLAGWLGFMTGTNLYQNKFGLRWVCTIGGFSGLSGLVIASYSTDVYSFIFFFAGVQGFGLGMCYMPPLICAWEWFPEKKGLVSGLQSGSYGFSSLIFGFVSYRLVNPDDKKPSIYVPENDVTYFEASVANRVPEMLRTLAIMWSILLIVSLVLLNQKSRVSYENLEEES